MGPGVNCASSLWFLWGVSPEWPGWRGRPVFVIQLNLHEPLADLFTVKPLKTPDFFVPCVMRTDVPEVELGAILCQELRNIGPLVFL